MKGRVGLTWMGMNGVPAVALIADQVRNDVVSCPVGPPCGYCLKASMTAARSVRHMDSRLRGNDGEGLFCLVSPSPLIPLPSRDLCKTYRHSRVGGNL